MKQSRKNKRGAEHEKPPVREGSKPSFPKPASGVPNSTGGSREGNIGHMGDDNGGNSHR